MAPSHDNSEPIMDRFIPANSSHGVFHALQSDHPRLVGFNLPKRLGVNDGNVFDETILNLARTTMSEGLMALGPVNHNGASNLATTESSKDGRKATRDVIAEALDFNRQNRVLKFSPVKSNGVTPSPSASSSFYSSSLPSRSTMESDSSFASISKTPPKFKGKARTQIPYRVLNADGLRNDFYSNLISWSKLTNRVAVGLEYCVYIWSENDGAVSLDMSEPETISCVSFSNDDLIIVATKSGRISLFNQHSLALLDEFFNVGTGAGTCCVSWFPGPATRFAAGNERGQVCIFEIVSECSIVLLTEIRSNQEQICGIAINNEGTQISVGGNDNCCTVWNLKDIAKPVFKYYLPHQAAVKAIAYCPWSTSLLATGGGSRDRTIRFWHTNSGTLLDSVKTNGQITSLIWSKCKKQIVATFGFTGTENASLVTVYTYPKMEEVIQVDALPDLRVLSAATSPDSCSICVATNDETVRFYEIWDPSNGRIIETQENGLFGSDIIELSEGIPISGGTIR